jgi:thiol-disulfide isomerase/thioredoxin
MQKNLVKQHRSIYVIEMGARKMKFFAFAALLIAMFAVVSYGQHEYAPIEQKEIEYKDWTYKNAIADGKTNLRDFIKGKKLVLVFYFAPWCHSSRFEAPVLEKFQAKYSDKGFGIIGVSNYDTVEAIRYELKTRNLTFPVVVETTKLTARETSQHYKYRWSTGDHRKWGTPWNIFLIPDELNGSGDVLTEKTFVANGELVEFEAETFIRERLGLPTLEETPNADAPDKGKDKAIEECKTGDQ